MVAKRAVPTRSWAIPTLVATCVIGFLVAIVATPWLMKSAVRSGSWNELSNIGQAYGGISAILSGLAFCGVAGSLLLQWRQVRLTQLMTLRERHFELVKLAIEDPGLALSRPSGMDPATGRQWMVINLWVAHWAMQWDARMLTGRSLFVVFEELFRMNAGALEWWVACGAHWDSDPDRRRRAFMRIADEAYRAVVNGHHANADLATSSGGVHTAAYDGRTPSERVPWQRAPGRPTNLPVGSDDPGDERTD